MKYRIGRKQKRALLSVEGSRELAMFNYGQEELAQLVCDLLNKHSENSTVIKSVCQYQWHNKEIEEYKICSRCGMEKEN